MSQQLDKLSKKDNIHTLLIGASNTPEGKAFFSFESNGNKFWELLSNMDNSFSGTAETSKLISKGVFIFDIAADEKDKDDKTKSTLLQLGFAHIEELLKKQPSIKRIAFIGQQAAKWFFIHFINKIHFENKDHLDKENLFEEGKQKWVFDQTISCFILDYGSQQVQDDKKKWIEFWNEVLLSVK